MWGKILGALFGMALLKIPGLFIGLLVGHWFDKSYGGTFASRGGFNGFSRDRTEAQGIFRYNTFAVMGHLAKADGAGLVNSAGWFDFRLVATDVNA